MNDRLNDSEDALSTTLGCAGCLAIVAFCLFAGALALYGIVRLVGWLGGVFGW